MGESERAKESEKWRVAERQGSRWVDMEREEWEGGGGLEKLFSRFSFGAGLTHTTYAAFVSIRFPALKYNWGITHSLHA